MKKLNSAYDNRLTTKDYWGEDWIHIGFSRKDEGLIAIGEPLPDGGERWVHINIYDLIQVIDEAKSYWHKHNKR